MPIVSVLRTVDREQITVSTSVVRLDIAKRRARPIPELVEISVFTAPVRWTDNGTDPTSALGHVLIPTGQPIILDNRGRIEEFRAIRQGTVDGVLEVSYRRA